ncbi:MAG: metal-dependent transcriptional regulator [Dehalococcoidia bacterium]|jgi:DtxR family Mn-dependent transcriptional regulator|nr:metal-dependent transcriptional regulator [Dehalococcoidia bacterium]
MVKQETQREQTASMEDYLEAIAKLGGARKAARVKQISEMLGVKMPSVTSALRKLSEQELVEHERYGHIKLTPQGDEVARDVISRHEALTRFFAQALGINRETAEEDACKIEHVISPLSMERLTKFVEFVKACPLGGANFASRYEYYLEHGELPQDCSNRGVKKRR